MKKIFLFLALTTLSISAFAFRVDARVSINNQRASATVVNQWARPIVCSGELKAVDAGARWITEWMSNIVIYPGQYAHLHATAHGYGNYLRSASARINCNWY